MESVQLTKEEEVAWRLLAATTVAAVSELPRFSGWLMTVLGAVFAFFMVHYSAVSLLIAPIQLHIALALFGLCILSGLLAVWLTVPIKAGLALSNEALLLRGKQIEPLAFVTNVASAMIFPYKCLFLRRITSGKASDALSAIRLPAKLSQYQALLVLFQFVCTVALVFVLATGING